MGKNSDKKDRIVAGWRLIDVWHGGTNNKWLNTQYWMIEKQCSFDIFAHPIQIEVKVPDPLANHGMSAVKEEFRMN